MKKMDKELKTLWVEALRSGKYKQGRGRLFSPEWGTYCCLGVGAEAFGILQDDGSIQWGDVAYSTVSSWEDVPVLTEEVNSEVMSYLITCNDLPRSSPLDTITLNIQRGSAGLPPTDRHPRDFSEIADFIEEYL